MKKQYSGDYAAFEKKLARVMERLGVEKYSYDWVNSRNGNNCYVEMRYGASTYRFENSSEKSEKCGRKLTYGSDLFAAIVYSLEGLARAVEQDIFTLDMLLAGVPALPAAKPVEQCFLAMGFTERPQDVSELKARYRSMAKDVHPDTGGSKELFEILTENYNRCLQLMEES